MSEHNVAPTWSIGPGWDLSTMSGQGSSTEYYYYVNKRRVRLKLPEIKVLDNTKIDWSMNACQSEALTLNAEKVLAEARRVGTLKEK